jgi:site-specific recombinase XerD
MLPLTTAIAAFLTDLEQANRSPHTQRAYASDLAQFATSFHGSVADITVEVLRQFFAQGQHLQPATRARKQAALASFLTWAVKHDLIAINPMVKIERVQHAEPVPRGLRREQIDAILACIPRDRLRDRLLFRLLVETGLRISEALAIHIDDLTLTQDDEHVRVTGKGGRQRTLLLDDPLLVTLLRRYLKQTGYQHGLLFRAEKNGDGGPLRYQSVQARWAAYGRIAGITCTLHQLRHSHATDLVNDGVSLATIRKRLGHRNIQTTLRYAEQSDAAADAELRARRRRGATG